MSWADEVEELNLRKSLALRMGGQERIDRQHSQGKLTVRERLDLFADKGSLREFMGLAGYAEYQDGKLVDFTPKASVDAVCKIDGRKVIVSGGDFTVRGGSGGGRNAGGMGQELSAPRRALEWRLPFVRLLDAAGGSVRSFEEMQQSMAVRFADAEGFKGQNFPLKLNITAIAIGCTG